MQYSQQPVFAYTTSPVPAGPYGAQQPQVYQIQQQNAPAIRAYAREDAKTTVTLGAVQLVVGILSIAFQSGALSIENQQNLIKNIYTAEFVGYGLWCGAMYLGAGIMGIVAGKRNGLSHIIGFLVLNIICSIIAWVHLGFAAANLGLVKSCQTYGYYDSYYSSGYYSNGYYSSGYYYSYRAYCQGQRFDSWVALDSLQIILSVVEFVIAVTSSSICCRALGCCCSQPSQPTYIVQQQPLATNMIVHANSGQPMMSVPVGYLNQGFTTSYPALQPGPAFGYAPAATSMLPPPASASTSNCPPEGAFAPPPYQERRQDLNKGPSGSTDSSQNKATAPANISVECSQLGASRPANNVDGNLYAAANAQQHYDNVDQYEILHA